MTYRFNGTATEFSVRHDAGRIESGEIAGAQESPVAKIGSAFAAMGLPMPTVCLEGFVSGLRWVASMPGAPTAEQAAALRAAGWRERF